MRLFLSPSRQNRGNALFLILIAVALFAALAYAVTQSGRGGGNMNAETDALDAATIMQYASSVEQAVTRMMLSNICTDATLSFEHTSSAHAADYANGAAPEACEVFAASGGGVAWQLPPACAQAVGGAEYWFSSGIWVHGVGTDYAGTVTPATYSDLLLTTIVPRGVCLQINNGLGNVNTGGNPPESESADYDPIPPRYNGTYGWWDDFAYAGNAPELQGRYSGCYHSAVTGHHYFYHVLLAR